MSKKSIAKLCSLALQGKIVFFITKDIFHITMKCREYSYDKAIPTYKRNELAQTLKEIKRILEENK